MQKLIRLAQKMFGMRNEKVDRAAWTEEYCVGFLNGLQQLLQRFDRLESPPKTVSDCRAELQELYYEYAERIREIRKDQ